MGRKILETLTESMFYVLMALLRQARCGRRSPTLSPPNQKPGAAGAGHPRTPSWPNFRIGADSGDRRGGPQAHLRPHGRGPGPLRKELVRLRSCLADAEEEAQP